MQTCVTMPQKAAIAELRHHVPQHLDRHASRDPCNSAGENRHVSVQSSTSGPARRSGACHRCENGAGDTEPLNPSPKTLLRSWPVTTASQRARHRLSQHCWGASLKRVLNRIATRLAGVFLVSTGNIGVSAMKTLSESIETHRM
jgi:hypothetical protein